MAFAYQAMTTAPTTTLKATKIPGHTLGNGCQAIQSEAS